ncbi:tellurite resistance/C4-dicarboxylate transporter family protein [Halomonas shantousis]
MDRIALLVDTAAANLFPGYFALVMATGAVSVASHLLGLAWIALPLLYVNCLAYAILIFLTLLRAMRHSGRLVQDMHTHSKGPGFFTLVAGTCILGSQMQLVAHAPFAARLLGVIGIGLWWLIMYWFFVAVTVRTEKPTLRKGINGAWLLASVGTQSIAVLTVLVDWPQAATVPALFFAICMFLIGCMLYLAIIPLIFYRLTFVPVDGASLTPPYWINMGAMAIATLAGSSITLVLEESVVLQSLLPFIKGMTVFMWAAATWWIPLLVGLTLWRHLIARQPLRYNPQYWGMVFPLGMYTTCTIRLSDALDLSFLLIIPRVTLWVALFAWLMVAGAMLLSLVYGQRQNPSAPV